MRLGIAFRLCIAAGTASVVSAQDSRFHPDRQQIPTPGCLILKGAWEGRFKPCTQDEHDALAGRHSATPNSHRL